MLMKILETSQGLQVLRVLCNANEAVLIAFYVPIGIKDSNEAKVLANKGH